MLLMRVAAAIACLVVAGCAAPAGAAFSSQHRDRFMIVDDACGASRFAHLVGEELAEIHRAALPHDASIVDRVSATTLEYTPHRLNVVLDGSGRVIAVGCF
jgi:hypothetical protein